MRISEGLKRNIAYLFWLLLSAVLFCCADPVRPLANGSDGFQESLVILEKPEAYEGIDLNVSYGYRDVARSGEYLPVEVDVTNGSGRDISGKLYIEAELYDNNILKYDYDIKISENSKEKFQTTINVPDDQASLRISLFSDQGELLSETEKELVIHGGSELLIGILSNKPDSLSYLRGINFGGSELQTRTVVLDPQRLPDSKEGLEQLDLMVISDFNLSRLEDDLIDAIFQWVRDGGILLLGTGAASDPLGGFSGLLGDPEISETELQDVNMGIQYSQDGPDGARLELMTRDIYAEDGIQVMQSGSLAMLTTIAAGSGTVGITAFSLCDIEDFCLGHPDFAEDLLTSLIGDTRIRSLEAALLGSSSRLQKIRRIVDIADGNRFPNITVYAAFALIYMAICGPLLYFSLKKRGLSLYYPLGVLLSSFLAVLILWTMSIGTRFTSTFGDYASIFYLDGDSIRETGFMKISSPQKGDISLNYDRDGLLLPLLPSFKDTEEYESLNGGISMELESGFDSEEQTLSARDTKEDAQTSPEKESIHISSERAFSEAYFETDRTSESGEGSPLDIEIGYFNDALRGRITNNTEQDLRDAGIMFFGRIIRIGDIAAGETRDLSELEMVYGPTGSARITSAYLTELHDLSQDDPDYSGVLKCTELLSYYMEEMPIYHDRGAVFTAFYEGGGMAEAFLMENGIEGSGISLIASTAQVDLEDDGSIYRSVIVGSPRVVSGSYDVASNTMSGTASAVLEYNLGTDVSLSSVRFNELSEVFWGREFPSGEVLEPFSGAVSLYNYVTGSYDLMDISSRIFSRDEIVPYLSPENAVMIRFIPDENAAEGTEMFLPVPSVTGVG